MESWKPYVEVRNHPPDFRIRYMLYTEKEGGRKNPVFPESLVALWLGQEDLVKLK
jgi:hypothetical protein